MIFWMFSGRLLWTWVPQKTENGWFSGEKRKRAEKAKMWMNNNDIRNYYTHLVDYNHISFNSHAKFHQFVEYVECEMFFDERKGSPLWINIRSATRWFFPQKNAAHKSVYFGLFLLLRRHRFGLQKWMRAKRDSRHSSVSHTNAHTSNFQFHLFVCFVCLFVCLFSDAAQQQCVHNFQWPVWRVRVCSTIII